MKWKNIFEFFSESVSVRIRCYGDMHLFSRQFRILSGCLILLISLAHCTAKGKQLQGPSVSAEVPATQVDGEIMKPGSLKEALELTGTLEANQQVDIVSELTRKLVRVNAREGYFVKAGTLLFELDADDLKAQLDKLTEEEKLASLNEERLRALIKREAVVQQDYDQAFTTLRVLKAQIQELHVTIAKTQIKAPFNGRIGIIHVYPGALVNANTVLTNIVDNSVIKLDFSVPEKYAGSIEIGSSHQFSVATDSKQYTARVAARESKLDPNSRTLMIRAVCPNPGGILLPGQSARLSLLLHASNKALMVSSQALIPSSLGYSVFVARNNQVQLIPVELGLREPAKVEVLKGLKICDTVVTSNILRLYPGASVQFITLN